jgi:hypothetical protein
MNSLRRVLASLACATVVLMLPSAAAAQPGVEAVGRQLDGVRQTAPHVLQQLPESCVPAVDVVAPQYVLQGEPFEVTVAFSATCTRPLGPLSLVLVLDSSGSVPMAFSAAQKDGARHLINRLELPSHPERTVGVVEFDSRARTLCQLTNTTARALGCVARVRNWGGTRLDYGIDEGLKVLLGGRSNATDRDLMAEYMFVSTDAVESSIGADIVRRAWPPQIERSFRAS